jgi:hypothetical protein
MLSIFVYLGQFTCQTVSRRSYRTYIQSWTYISVTDIWGKLYPFMMHYMLNYPCPSTTYLKRSKYFSGFLFYCPSHNYYCRTGAIQNTYHPASFFLLYFLFILTNVFVVQNYNKKQLFSLPGKSNLYVMLIVSLFRPSTIFCFYCYNSLQCNIFKRFQSLGRLSTRISCFNFMGPLSKHFIIVTFRIYIGIL